MTIKLPLLSAFKLTDVLQVLPEGIILCAPDQRTLFANAAASRLTGLPQEGFYLTELARLLQTRAPVNMAEVMRRVLSEGTSVQLRDLQVAPFFYDFFIVPLYDSDKKIIGGVILMHDVTDRVELDQRKTEFISLAAHQLRTPLSTVNWYTEMLLADDAGKLNNEQKSYLGEVYKGNQRMVALVNALLNVSRLELGTFTVEPEPTDIVKLAQSASNEQQPQIEAKKIKFSEKYADNLPELNADPKLLQMVFQNLLSNAIKYTPENGKVSIKISLNNPSPPPLTLKGGDDSIPPLKVREAGGVTKRAENDKVILITVSDTGCGIPKNQQDKIFTKLFRADNVREKDTEGTGLGLYIVKSIVEHSGGKIWFESEENKGTTFYVTLPLTGVNPVRSNTPMASAEVLAPRTSNGVKKKEGTKALS